MVKEEFETSGFDVICELVQLDTVLVVNEDIFLLSDGKVRMIV